MKQWIFAILIGTMLAGGCASGKHPFNEWWASSKYENYVPATAKSVAKGTGTLTFRAPDRGTVYILDLSAPVHIKEATVPHALGSGFVFKGSQVEFDPRTGEVRINGKTDFTIKNVRPDHTFELRFDPLKQVEPE